MRCDHAILQACDKRHRKGLPISGALWVLFALALGWYLPTVAHAQGSESSDRGWMGLYIRDLDAQDLRALDLPTDQRGVVVSGVDEDGPAAEVGLEPGDVIVSLAGKPLASRFDFVAVLGEKRVGDRIRLQVVRRRISRNVEFRLQPRPREMQGSSAINPTPTPAAATATGAERPRLSCLELHDANLAHYFGVSAGDGVLVLEATGKGVDQFHAGDVITAVDDTPVSTVGELQRLLRAQNNAKHKTLRVVRGRRSREIRIPRETGRTVRLTGDFPASAVSENQAWALLRQEISQLRQRLQDLEAQVDAQVRR